MEDKIMREPDELLNGLEYIIMLYVGGVEEVELAAKSRDIVVGVRAGVEACQADERGDGRLGCYGAGKRVLDLQVVDGAGAGPLGSGIDRGGVEGKVGRGIEVQLIGTSIGAKDLDVGGVYFFEADDAAAADLDTFADGDFEGIAG